MVKLVPVLFLPLVLPAAQEELLKAVESRYNRAESLQVVFKETYTLPGKPSRSESGTLTLRKPARMRWDYASPAGKLFVSDGKYFWLYTPHNNRVEKMRMKESEDMRAPLAFLLGKLNFSKEFQNIQSEPRNQDHLITAEPRSDKLPYSQVQFLVAPGGQIRHVRIAGLDHSVLEFEFEGEKLNLPVNSKAFQFQIPAGAELVEAGQ